MDSSETHEWTAQRHKNEQLRDTRMDSSETHEWTTQRHKNGQLLFISENRGIYDL